MGVVLGESRGTQPCVFSGPVAAAGDERYLVCAAGAAAVEPVRNRFLLCVLQWQRVAVHVCVGLCPFSICACRSQGNGCMIVATLCCHARRERCGLAT